MATSKALATTRSSRGTDCYRAPEVLHGRYNNRSDMFALGCLVFKVVTGVMPFGSDWEVSEYARGTNRSVFPDRWPPADLDTTLSDIGLLASDLLSVDPTQRPGAAETIARLCRLWDGDSNETSFDLTGDPFFDVEGASSTTNDGPIAQPVVQAALKFAAPNLPESLMARKIEVRQEPRFLRSMGPAPPVEFDMPLPAPSFDTVAWSLDDHNRRTSPKRY
jgi:serine/threonine protein kinase